MLTIAWDVDDVLNNLMEAWLGEAWKPRHPECALSYSEITENPPHYLLGVPESEYHSSLDAFRLSDRARVLKPNPVIAEWLRAFGSEYHHIALTARPLESAPQAAEWTFRHFRTHIRAFAVVPARLPSDVPGYHRNKSDFIQWLGKVDILIDDSEENIVAAQKVGIHGVLYPQPWNSATGTVQTVLESLNQLVEAN